MLTVPRQTEPGSVWPLLRKTLPAFVMIVAPVLAAAQDTAALPPPEPLQAGRRAMAPEVILRTKDAVALCLSADPHWIDFCNGLAQGYADHAILGGKVCFPDGITRRQLVETFTAPEVVMAMGFIDDWPAIETALELFIKRYPCR